MKGHLYLGERDTFSGSQIPVLTSIQGSPYYSEHDWPQRGLISLHWSQWLQYSLHNMNNITALVGTTRQQFAREKLTVIFLFSCLKNDTCNRFQGRYWKKNPLLVNFNKPLPSLYSRDTSIQGTLSSVLRVSPEL